MRVHVASGEKNGGHDRTNHERRATWQAFTRVAARRARTRLNNINYCLRSRRRDAGLGGA